VRTSLNLFLKKKYENTNINKISKNNNNNNNNNSDDYNINNRIWNHYDWLEQLVGGEHASQMVEAPLFNPPCSQLSHGGVWETGQGSHAAEAEVEWTIEDEVEHAAEFVFGSSSQIANYEQEDNNVVPLRRTTK
jgi:hypothetical protein